MEADVAERRIAMSYVLDAGRLAEDASARCAILHGGAVESSYSAPLETAAVRQLVETVAHAHAALVAVLAHCEREAAQGIVRPRARGTLGEP